MSDDSEQTPVTEAVTFGVSPGKRTHGMVIAGLLAASGVVALVAAGPAVPDGETIGVVALALAAVVAFHVRRTTGTTGPGMVLDGNGIWFREWGMDTVPWRFVAGARMAGNRLRPLVYIELDESADLLGHMEADGGARPALSPLVRRTRLIIPNSALDAPLNQVAVAIRAAHDNAQMMTKSSSL
jgi:hypothetical protein